MKKGKERRARIPPRQHQCASLLRAVVAVVVAVDASSGSCPSPFAHTQLFTAIGRWAAVASGWYSGGGWESLSVIITSSSS